MQAPVPALSEFTVCWEGEKVGKLSLKPILCMKTEMCVDLGDRSGNKSGYSLWLSGKVSWKRCYLIRRTIQPGVTQVGHCLELLLFFHSVMFLSLVYSLHLEK